MFDWALFLILLALSMPGVMVIGSGMVNALEKYILVNLPEGKKRPSSSELTVLVRLQSTLLVAISAAVGTALAFRVGLKAPFFQALVTGQGIVQAFWVQLLPALIVGTGGALVFVAAYYLVFRPRLDADTLRAMENLRMELGIWGRILYGGIVEELLTRWGLMSLLVWLGALAAGQVNSHVIWVAIIVSGVLFGIGHLPSYVIAGCRRTKWFIGLMISLNLWASVVFGWLFWHHGLLSAMLAHMLFHVIWLPFDMHFAKKRQLAGS